MTVINLDSRIKKLESRTKESNPFEGWTDEELDAFILARPMTEEELDSYGPPGEPFSHLTNRELDDIIFADYDTYMIPAEGNDE